MSTAMKAQIKQPVQSRSKATFAAVTEATIQVLLRDGADALTTTRVAERAGVSVGSLYQYFPNKSALIEAVRRQYFDLMSQNVNETLSSCQNLPPIEQIRLAIETLVRTKRENLELNQAMAKAAYARQSVDFPSEIVEHFTNAVIRLMFKDQQPSKDDAEQIRFTVAALEGALSHAVKNNPDWLEERWFVEKLNTIAAAGLISSPPSAES